MATAKKRSKKASVSRSATAKKTMATKSSAARKTAAPAPKTTGPAARAAGKSVTGKAVKKSTGRKKVGAVPARTAARGASAGAVKKTATRAAGAAKKAVSRKAPAAQGARKAAPAAAVQRLERQRAGVKKAGVKKVPRTMIESAAQGDPILFQPFSEGERAAALRVMTEDPRLAAMASVGRYRVIAIEPVVVKPSHELSQRRLARVVVYDYAAERSIDACVDLDGGSVTHLGISRSQPMLSREEEAAAIAIALGDEQVQSKLSLGDEAQVAMHYWSRSGTSLAYSRRSAAVLFGQAGRSPSLVAVVDLLDSLVCELVPATEW